MTWGGWLSPFCRAKYDFWRPRPLQNEEPATNLARGFLYKIRIPNPFLFGAHLWFSQPLASTKWGACMSAHVSRMAASNKESPQTIRKHIFHPPCFSTKWETCKINIMCIFECWQTPKPLQNQEPTVSASYKRSPLQNQEPALSIFLQALRLSKKWFWRTPGGPDNGVEIFGDMNFARESRACLQDCMGSAAPPRLAGTGLRTWGRKSRKFWGVPLQMWNVEQQTYLSWSLK